MASQGYCAGQSPQQFVQDFYIWFFKADAGRTPAYKKDEIYAYVDKNTVAYVRDQSRMESACYFTRANMEMGKWKNVKTFVGEPIFMHNNIVALPVKFYIKGEEKYFENFSEDFYVLVFIKKYNKTFRIIKISDIYPYS